MFILQQGMEYHYSTQHIRGNVYYIIAVMLQGMGVSWLHCREGAIISGCCQSL